LFVDVGGGFVNPERTMKKQMISCAIATTALAGVLIASPAQAQATRTWVSGVGDDANPCSRTAPCKTFAGAISKTASGGEINCLDPGGFGGVTLVKPITLNCKYTIGSILVAGAPGITINTTGATDRVTLRGIQIQGINQTVTPGTIGVRIIAAKSVSIEDSVITGMGQQGIADQRTAGNVKLFIRNTVISNNTGAGISLGATGTNNNTEIDNVSAINNSFGLAAGVGNNVLIRRSVFSGNTSVGVEADNGASIAVDTARLAATLPVSKAPASRSETRTSRSMPLHSLAQSSPTATTGSSVTLAPPRPRPAPRGRTWASVRVDFSPAVDRQGETNSLGHATPGVFRLVRGRAMQFGRAGRWAHGTWRRP